MIDLDPTTALAANRFRFDPEVVDRMRVALAGGESTLGVKRLVRELAPPLPGDLVELRRQGAGAEDLASLGRAALARGEVGVVVLAGGMATRFGGVVKAVVELAAGRSFLSLKMEAIERVASSVGRPIPVVLMASFATSDDIRNATADAGPSLPIQVIDQSVTLRLTKSGDVFYDSSGRPSLCATGHGDLLPTLRSSGALASFRRQGGRVLMVSNVDNLAATLDPRVIGAHYQSGKSVTVEVVRKEPGDRGGVPVRVGNGLQIVEEFRLPVGFDASQVPFFNTNTFLFDAEAIDTDFDLEWFPVVRKVDGRESVQAERLLGQITAFLPTQFLVVERHGPDGRFLPVKDREELDRRRPDIVALLRGLGINLPEEQEQAAAV